MIKKAKWSADFIITAQGKQIGEDDLHRFALRFEQTINSLKAKRNFDKTITGAVRLHVKERKYEDAEFGGDTGTDADFDKSGSLLP